MKFFTAILAISLLATDAASKAEPSSGNAGNTKKVKKVSHLRADAKEDGNVRENEIIYISLGQLGTYLHVFTHIFTSFF